MKKSLQWLIFMIFVSIQSIGLHGSGMNPIQCQSGSKTCILNNFQGLWTDRKPCKVAEVVYPTTEQELIDAVANAVRRNQSIKVVSKYSHSIPKVACPRGKSGVLISTSKYDSRIGIDKDTMTVTVDAGVQLSELLGKLAEEDLAFPVSPFFNGISVGGVISTGAHGSSLHGRGGSLYEYVMGITIVVPASKSQGYAKLIKLSASDQDLNAAKLSLGVLGAISQVTLAVEPMFKRSVVKQAKNDNTLEDDILEIATNYEFGEINWHVSQGKLILTLSKKVPVSTPGNGRNINYTPRLGSSVKYWRGVGEQLMASGNSSAVCAISLNNTANRVAGGDGLVNENNTFKGYPVVGFNHLMQTGGGCQNISFLPSGDIMTCPWDPELPGQIYFEASILVPFSKIKQVIRDIKKLRDKNPQKLCGANLYGGTVMRFVKGSNAYLGTPTDSVAIDVPFFRNRGSNTPILDEDGIEELEQMLLKKYKGIPHWGKNRDFAFDDMGSKVRDIAKFLEVKKRMDPQGLFSSEWSDAILGISHRGGGGVSKMKKYCALEGLCICSSDEHCAPEDGYLCKAGIFYKNARVCRKVL